MYFSLEFNWKKRFRGKNTKLHICHLMLKGLAKLGNIAAETMFLDMFPGLAKLGNICFGRKICVREAKMFLTSGKNIFCFPSSKICFRKTCFPRG